MFQPDISYKLDGQDICRPYNAITLTSSSHVDFGSVAIYFDPTEVRHKYIIRAWDKDFGSFSDPPLPIERKLRLDPNKEIEPPSPALLAIHRAVGRILHLSAAGEYIDGIWRDMKNVRVIAEDGSSDLGSYVSAHLGGWMEVSTVG